PPTSLDCTFDPTTKCTGGQEKAFYRAPMQDNDPIRRPCVNVAGAIGEDNCSHSGSLGLVLPLVDVPEPPPHTDADRYNATPCVRGRLVSVTAPDVWDAVTQTKVICSRGLLCPNGDVCNNLGGCLAPATATGSAQCLASKLTAPATTIS